MAIKVAAWNIEGRLSRFAEKGRRGSPEQIVEAIDRLKSDIIVFPEAFDGVNPIEPGVQQQLDSLGYTCIAVAYDERGDRQYQAVAEPHMLLLTKLEIAQFEKRRLGDIRTIIVANVVEPETQQVIQVFGVHLDDRSEANRLKQVGDLVKQVADSPFPVVVMGDFNAMHAYDSRAKLLRSGVARLAIDRIPHAGTKDILQRLSGMAIGDTMRRLEQSTSLRDSDLKRRATTTPKMRGQEWMPSIRMVQIDHIMVSPELVVKGFEVGADAGSDHRSVTAFITTRQSMPPVL